jgi:hypothetical protein
MVGVSSKALLIGAQTGGLSGVDYDIESMSETLARRDFTVERCEGSAATRDGILQAFEELIAGADRQDAVLVYYSGHGGYLPGIAGAIGPDAIDLQFIVPSDFDLSSAGDFRGITSIELSWMVKRLTGRTSNVVVALDCCHAAHMSRDGDLVPRGLTRPADVHFRPTATQVRAFNAALPPEVLAGWDPLGNRDAVRLVACQPWEAAVEYTNDAGQRTGVLTESLVEALDEFSGLPVSWSTLMQRVRGRVMRLSPGQRPVAEGPAGRRLFETVPADAVGAFPVTPVAPGRIQLDHAPLFGVQTGDEFAIVAPTAAGADSTVATATVDKIGAVVAFASVSLRPGWTEIPAAARAHLTSAAAPSVVVRVEAADAGLADAVEASPLLRTAADGEAAALTVHADDQGRIVIHDHAGPLHSPRPAGAVADVVRDLERLARATALRTLSGEGAFPLKQPLTVEWGRIVAGQPEPLPPSGPVLTVGERVYVRVRNGGGGGAVYASLIDVGVAADITHLTQFDPDGVRLGPGQEYVFGEDHSTGAVDGVELSWPASFDDAQARQETIVVLVTSAPLDVTGLAQAGVRGGECGAPGTSLLDRVVAKAALATRDLVSASRPATASTVRTIAFDLVPSAPLPRDTTTFLLDERPAPDLRIMTQFARNAGPGKVAVRLDELVAHRNRTWGGTDIRVDALVVTGYDDGHVAYRACTERFSRIHDEERLPLDRLLMFHGQPVDFLDLAIWVSRDTTGGLALGDLLPQQLTSAEVQGAGMQLLSLAGERPHAGAGLAAAGACVLLGNTAYNLLAAAADQTVGVYRTSLLACEDFGVGRHPADGLRRAQDFSFAYSVARAR